MNFTELLDENKKTKRKQDSESESLEKKQKTDNEQIVNNKTTKEEQNIKILKYVDLKSISTLMLDRCLIFSKLYKPENKAAVYYLSFDINTFKQLETNYLLDLKKENLILRTPFLRFPFGYSPVSTMTDKGEEKIMNTLRANVGMYLDALHGKLFEDQLDLLDNYLINKAYQNQDEWPLKIKTSKNPIPDPNGKRYSKEVIENAYTPIIRSATKYSNYVVFHFECDKIDNKRAYVNVWNEKLELITKVLTEENSTSNDGNTIIINKNDWGQCQVVLEKVFFSITGFGYFFKVTDIMLRPKSDNDPKEFNDSKELENCPF